MKMEKIVSVNIVGDKTGRVYAGEFTMKSVMSQRDEFNADLRRRQIIGPSPEGTPPAPALQWKAYMYGQIHARTLESPDFWDKSDGGLNIPDGNVVTEVYDQILKIEEDIQTKIKEESAKAYEKLQKAPKKEEKEEE